MRLNRLKCLLALTLIVAVGTSHAEPLKTHDQYLRHYETGFYSGLGVEISEEADAEKSERDDPSVNEESKAIPDRYGQLGLDSVEQLENFQYRRFRNADKQSIIVRNSSGDSYLLVLSGAILRSAGAEIKRGRTLLAGSSLITVCLKVRARTTKNLLGSRCEFGATRRIELIYPLKDMEQEKRVLKFLKAND